MGFTTDTATDIGKVRLLLLDTQEPKAIFTDEQIACFLGIEGTVLEAAALGLETISGQQAYVIKVIQLLDLKMDGAAVAESLLATAERFRARAAAIETNDWAGFEIAEQVDNSGFAWEEKHLKLLLRERGW